MPPTGFCTPASLSGSAQELPPDTVPSDAARTEAMKYGVRLPLPRSLQEHHAVRRDVWTTSLVYIKGKAGP